MAVRESFGPDGQRRELNRSSFLRPRRNRKRQNVQKSQPRQSIPPRQEITPPRTDAIEIQIDERIQTYDEARGTVPPVETQEQTQSAPPSVTNPIENNFTDGAPSNVAISVDPSNPYLKFIRNPYPSQLGENPMGNYSRSNGSVTLKGKYKQNTLTFKEYPLNGITATDGSYNFIIQFMDGTKYTSTPFLKELELEFSIGNPYRTLNSVSTVKVDDVLLSTYQSLEKFKLGEDYAEMDISDNINTKDEIIKHIDWLVASGNELRDVSEMGTFTHNPTDDIGFAFQPQIDGEDPSDTTPESDIGVDIGETVDPVTTTDSVDTEPSDPPVVNDVFPPFGVPGIRPNELRTFSGNGKRYRWDSGRRGIFGRRGVDNGTWICIGNTAPTQSTTTPTIPPTFTLPNNGFGGLNNIPSGNSYSGGKIICGELYRQGFLSEEIWEADQRFGRELYETNPRISLGYVFWAREVVKYMKKNPNHTKYLYIICKPWTEHMAYKMGISKKRNIVGNITQKIGYVYSLIVYNYYQIKWGRNRLTI